MPSGKTHDVFNLALLPLTAFTPKPFEPLTLAAGYVIGTLLFSPDLDLKKSRVTMRWGLLRILWLPYAKVATHRRISHMPVVGLLLRTAYIGVIFVIMLLLLNSCGINIDLGFGGATSRHALSFAIGMLIADTLHITLDAIVSLFKRLTSMPRGR